MDTPFNDLKPARPAEYGPEVLCASWNPAAAAVSEPRRADQDRPVAVAGVDADTFLKQVYRFQKI